MKWIFINYRLWQLCDLENEEAFFEANGESIRYEYQSFLRHPAEQRNTITNHDSFRRMAQKLWKNYLKERSLSLLSKIGQVKAAFCILSNWSPFRNEDWLWERSQTQKWLRIRKSQTEGGEESSTFSYCCNQTTSKYSFFIMYSTRDSWLLLNFQVILLCKRYQRYHH